MNLNLFDKKTKLAGNKSRACIFAENYYKIPVDVERALERGKFYIF